MTELEKAKHEVELINHAINTIKNCADEERKITHSKHTNQHYEQALQILELKRTGAEGYLFRLKVIGR